MTRSTVGIAAAVAALLLASPVGAQEEHEGHDAEHEAHMAMEMPTEGVRADLLGVLEMQEGKLVGLAEAMKGHWEWRPSDEVRSVGEVYGHVAAANMLIPTYFGIAPPEEFQGESDQATMGNLMALEQIEDPDETIEHLRHSFMHARHAIARVPDDRLEEVVQYFGTEGTVRTVMTTMMTHMSEHLGQSIAYARSNGVVPPWSAGGE